MSVTKQADRNTYDIKLYVGKKLKGFPGAPDYGVARQIEARLKKLLFAKKYGQPIPREIMHWLATLPERQPSLYRRLVNLNIVEDSLIGRQKLTELVFGTITPKKGFEEQAHAYKRCGSSIESARLRTRARHPELYTVKAEEGGYFQSLLADGVTAVHVVQQTRRISDALAGSGMLYWEDVKADKLKHWLFEQRASRKDFGYTTSNQYLKAVRAFVNWCRKKLKRDAEPNPLAELDLLDERSDVRRKRRVTTEEEIARLLAHVDASGYNRGLIGSDRGMLYRVAFGVALRRSELASLHPESFFEDDLGFSVRVKATVSKHRREDVVPVPAALAAILRPWLATKPAGKPLWPGYWKNSSCLMLQADLAAVGIPYKTDEGYFDFHATRHTGITRGCAVMNVDQLQQFARHGKIEMTMRYVHTAKRALRERADLLALPAPAFDPADAPSHPKPVQGRNKRVRKCVRTAVATTSNEAAPVINPGRTGGAPETTQPPAEPGVVIE